MVPVYLTKGAVFFRGSVSEKVRRRAVPVPSVGGSAVIYAGCDLSGRQIWVICYFVLRVRV